MDKNILLAAITTLNKIEVRGKDNLDRMLGVINALESLAHADDNGGANNG